MQARLVMTAQPQTFCLTDSIHDVATKFIKHNLTSAPVVNQYGELVGLLSEVALVRIFAIEKKTY